jgi:hypothetical protein
VQPSVVDLLFGASGVVPTTLYLIEQPALAMMAMLVLVVGACLCAIADPESPHRKAGQRRSHGKPH